VKNIVGLGGLLRGLPFGHMGRVALAGCYWDDICVGERTFHSCNNAKEYGSKTPPVTKCFGPLLTFAVPVICFQLEGQFWKRKFINSAWFKPGMFKPNCVCSTSSPHEDDARRTSCEFYAGECSRDDHFHYPGF
jgi:hypothetical protein